MMGALGLVALAVVLAWPGASRAEGGDEARVKALLEKLDDMWRADSSHAVVSMRVKTENYERSMKMESWSRGKDRSLVRILEPRKEKGTATLMRGEEMYTYLPKTDRTIRISSAMMSGSWMGSHFTNDDLVKQSRMAEDYTYKITFEGEREGQKIIEISLVPKEDAAVMWGRISVELRTEDNIPVRQRYYDEDGAVVRTMTFSRIKELGGRPLPTVMRVVPAENPDEFTEMVYEEIEFGVDVPDKLFSLNNLKR